MLRQIPAITLLAFGLAAVPAFAESPHSPEIRLYAMDCGKLEFKNLGPFSDTGEYDGHPGTLMASCFLLRHPNGDLLWDAGLGDAYANHPNGVEKPNYRITVSKTLALQLHQLGMEYKDIEHFAFSHGHADHLGNAPFLAHAKWIVNDREISWLTQNPAPSLTKPELLIAYDPKESNIITGDYDVFGDGSAKILFAPGHTPGHQVLLVTLPKHGSYLISGDLYHSRENRKEKRMPVFNVDRADTLASMDRIERIVSRKKAKIIIQHSQEDFTALPAFPAYLD